jgi:glutamate racemase
LIENNEHNGPGADYFVKEYLDDLFQKSSAIDTVLLGCTHYPLLKDKIEKLLPQGISIISQGEIVADSLVDYLHRHPEIESKCSKSGHISFYTTDSIEDFDRHAANFYGKTVKSAHASL